jgi:hypothetical protein
MYYVNIKVIKPEWYDFSKDDTAFFKKIKEKEDLEIMKYENVISFSFFFRIIKVHRKIGLVSVKMLFSLLTQLVVRL